MNLHNVTKALIQHKSSLEAQVLRVDQALQALGVQGRAKGKRRMSASARKRIADAQRARWAKWKAARRGKGGKA